VGAVELIEEAASDPALTPDQAAVALIRVVLWKATEGEKVGIAAIGELLKGLASLRLAGGGSDLKAVLRELKEEDGEDAPFSGET